MELPDQELGARVAFPYVGLWRGLGGSLHASWYLDKNICVNMSLYLYQI